MHEDVIHWTIQSQNYTKNRCMQAMVVTPIPVSNHLIRIFNLTASLDHFGRIHL